MAVNAISALRRISPDWVTIIRSDDLFLSLIAHPTNADGSPSKAKGVSLLVKTLLRGGVSVEEADQQTQFPKFCLERHINYNGTFCIELGSTSPFKDISDAERWWTDLEAYIQNQRFFDLFRTWPLNAQYAHGPECVEIQIQMEDIAGRNGWLEEVRSAIFFREGWLSGSLPAVSRNGRSLTQGRSPCPRNCVTSDKGECSGRNYKSDPNQQRPLISRKNCPHKSDIAKLVFLEISRRKHEDIFVKSLFNEGFKCCGAAAKCPLNNYQLD